MKIKLWAKGTFIFHGIGQGLFYSGSVNLQFPFDNQFYFIYDCGSSDSKLIENEVRKYKKTLKYNHIDMVVISHLHYDHVSGLDGLLKNLEVEYVFLPYLFPTERLILALRYTSAPDWYFEFLSDPVVFLMERGVRRVVLIGGEGPEEGSPEGLPNIPPGPTRPERDGIKLQIKLRDDYELIEKIKNTEGWSKKQKNTERLLLKSHYGYVKVADIWLFKFFNYKTPTNTINKFGSCINKILLGHESITINEAINDEKVRKNLIQCYKIISSCLSNGFNNTSLIMYHGPLGNPEANWWLSPWINKIYGGWHPSYCFWPRFFRNRRGFGQFLTGDINLNYRYDEISKHFQGLLEKTVISLVPHHGASKNWNCSILYDMPHPIFWVASAGIRNKYGHPRADVVLDILRHGHGFAWSNEIDRITIQSEITWR